MAQESLIQNVTNTAYDSVRELGEINTRLVQRLSQQQLEVLRVTMEAGARETQLISQPRDYQSLLSAQAALAGEYNQKFLEIARTTADILTETRDELMAWVQRGLERATSTSREAASTAQSAASTGKKRSS